MSAPAKIAVLTLGASNHANICSGLARAGGSPYALRAPRDLYRAGAVVIPGVANVAFLVDALDAAGLRGALLRAMQSGMPALGVCAGFQLCFDASEEAPQRRLLGLFAGHVRALRAPKLPHMGWNRLQIKKNSLLLDGISSGTCFYFAHSFAAPSGSYTIAECEGFSAAIARDNFYGVQFHPEKSAEAGLRLLKNFEALCR